MYAFDLVALLILLHVLAGQGAVVRLLPGGVVPAWAGRALGVALAVLAGVAVVEIVGGVRRGQAAELWPWVVALAGALGFGVYRGVRALNGRAEKRV